MSADKKSIFVWSPFVSKVGTVQNIINSLNGINKYSMLNTNLINVFGEWDDYKASFNLDKVSMYNFKFLRFLRYWNKIGFFKSRFSYLLIFIFSFFPLINLIKKQKPDFLIVHLISSLPLTIFNLFDFKTKLILHVAGHPKLNFFRKLIWKISSKKIYKVICPSQELKQLFLDNKIFNEEQIKIIEDPHLIISNIYKLKNHELNDNFFHESKVLIAIGRMTKQKNYSFLIKNFKKLTSKYKDIKLVIIGSGEEKNDLKNLIKELDILEKVKLIDHELNIYKYLKNSDYYISTSIWEGSSLAMIDAAYMGIPILCSDCPSGRKEFIGENERGFLYRQNDSENFLNLFDKMYALDHNEIKKIILKAKKQTKKFTPLKNFLKLNKVLN